MDMMGLFVLISISEMEIVIIFAASRLIECCRFGDFEESAVRALTRKVQIDGPTISQQPMSFPQGKSST